MKAILMMDMNIEKEYMRRGAILFMGATASRILGRE